MEGKIMLPNVRRKNFDPFLSNWFNDNFYCGMNRSAKSFPAVNIKEDEKGFNLELSIPGVKKEDLKIEVNDDILTISSDVKCENQEDRDGYKMMEFCRQAFCRKFYLPENSDAEKTSASLKDGILYIEIPKLEEEENEKSYKIEIS